MSIEVVRRFLDEPPERTGCLATPPSARHYQRPTGDGRKMGGAGIQVGLSRSALTETLHFRVGIPPMPDRVGLTPIRQPSPPTLAWLIGGFQPRCQKENGNVAIDVSTPAKRHCYIIKRRAGSAEPRQSRAGYSCLRSRLTRRIPVGWVCSDCRWPWSSRSLVSDKP
jgi:hypothetical protein